MVTILFQWLFCVIQLNFKKTSVWFLTLLQKHTSFSHFRRVFGHGSLGFHSRRTLFPGACAWGLSGQAPRDDPKRQNGTWILLLRKRWSAPVASEKGVLASQLFHSCFFFVFPQNKMKTWNTPPRCRGIGVAKKKLRRALPFTYSEHLNGQHFTVPCCYNFS